MVILERLMEHIVGAGKGRCMNAGSLFCYRQWMFKFTDMHQANCPQVFTAVKAAASGLCRPS